MVRVGGRADVPDCGSHHPAPAGSFIVVPRGTLHSFANTGAGPARYLQLFWPVEWGATLRSGRPSRTLTGAMAWSLSRPNRTS
jgi:hypothetical protein